MGELQGRGGGGGLGQAEEPRLPSPPGNAKRLPVLVPTDSCRHDCSQQLFSKPSPTLAARKQEHGMIREQEQLDRNLPEDEWYRLLRMQKDRESREEGLTLTTAATTPSNTWVSSPSATPATVNGGNGFSNFAFIA